MKNTENELLASFRIKDIELLEISLNQPLEPLKNQTIFHFNLGLEQKIYADIKLVKVITKIGVSQDNNEAQLASITVGCIFEVINLEEFIDTKTKQVNLSESILNTFNAISISTVRGIMYSQFKGTFLQHAILPVIDTAAIMKTNNQADQAVKG